MFMLFVSFFVSCAILFHLSISCLDYHIAYNEANSVVLCSTSLEMY